MKNIKYIINIIMNLALSSLVVIINPALSYEFYKDKDRYKGFYWFEKQQSGIKQQNQSSKVTLPSPEEAASNLKQREIELNKARSIMLDLAYFPSATPEALNQAVLQYKLLEQQMFNASIRLGKAWEMANFINPELVERVNSPVNAYGNRLKRAKQEKAESNKITEFARLFDLVFFSNPTCPYCKEFEPILARFTDKYNFKTEMVNSSPSYQSPYFKSFANKKLIKSLGITEVPLVIAISKDGEYAFELARGFLTIKELEEQVLMAIDALELKIAKNKLVRVVR